jgi:hypothetical protein
VNITIIIPRDASLVDFLKASKKKYTCKSVQYTKGGGGGGTGGREILLPRE